MADPMTVRPPLGLPRGSVRALLTMLIVAVVLVQTVRGQKLELLWAETLMIALAHYFTSRRFVDLSPEAIQRLEAEGLLPQEGQPLYLPRHSIRVLLFGAFAALTVYLYFYDWDTLIKFDTLTLLGVVASYILGLVMRAIRSWWTKGKQTPGVLIWEDIKAGVVLLAIAVTAAAHLFNRGDLVRDFDGITLGLVLFYFGSR